MGEGASGWLWLIIDVGLVAILGIALVYGSAQWHKSRAERQSVAPEYKEERRS